MNICDGRYAESFLGRTTYMLPDEKYGPILLLSVTDTPCTPSLRMLNDTLTTFSRKMGTDQRKSVMHVTSLQPQPCLIRFS